MQCTTFIMCNGWQNEHYQNQTLLFYTLLYTVDDKEEKKEKIKNQQKNYDIIAVSVLFLPPYLKMLCNQMISICNDAKQCFLVKKKPHPTQMTHSCIIER